MRRLTGLVPVLSCRNHLASGLQISTIHTTSRSGYFKILVSGCVRCDIYWHTVSFLCTFLLQLCNVYIQVKGQFKGVVLFTYVKFPGYKTNKKKLVWGKLGWDFNSRSSANMLWKFQILIFLIFSLLARTTNTWQVCFSCQKINHSTDKWLKLTFSFQL